MQDNFPKARIKQAVSLLKLISSNPRLGILCLLSERELSVTQIGTKINLSQSALSQHLSKLKSGKIVKTRKVKQVVYYSIGDKTVLKILSTLHKIYCK